MFVITPVAKIFGSDLPSRYTSLAEEVPGALFGMMLANAPVAFLGE